MTTETVGLNETSTGATAEVVSDRTPMVLRVASHLAVWTSVLVSVGVDLGNGWRPVGDNAAITSRAFQVFTAHPPLVGLLSTASTPGHPVYDPGPLLFWLLAVPVRIDPTHGALWGAALLAGAALSVSIEAVWSTRMWAGSAVIAFCAVDMFWLTPSVFENISWNAYFPVPFFIATLALAWVVASGRLGWWPVLVLTASVAAQTHLLFSIPCTVLALLAPVLGLLIGGRPERRRWIGIGVGVGVGVVCWFAPVLQQLFGSSGNVTATATSQSGQSRLGIHFGLSVLGRTGFPIPIWLTHQPTDIFSLVDFETRGGATAGVVLLVILTAVAIWAGKTKRGALAALAGVVLAASITFVVAFAIVPTNKAASLYYLLNALWPIGIAIWSTVIWAAASGLRRRLQRDDNGQGTRVVPATWQHVGVIATVGILALVCALGIAGATGFRPAENTVSWDRSDATSIGSIATAIEHEVRKGPVMFTLTDVSGSILSTIWVSEGVGWKLESDGWEPGLTGFELNFTGIELPRGTNYTLVKVTMAGTHVGSISTFRCNTSDDACPPSSPTPG